MFIRVVLIGVHPAELSRQLNGLPSSLELQIAGSYADTASARAALASLSPDVAIVAASLSDGSGFEFIGSLAKAERPHAIVFVSAREGDAVRAFELQATDFLPLPIVPSRLAESMARARDQALRVALLRTAEELQRLIGATVSSRASVRRSGGGRWLPATAAPVDPWSVTDRESEASGSSSARASTGGLRMPMRPNASGGPWRQAESGAVSLAELDPRVADRTADGVLDMTQTVEQGGAVEPDGRPLRVLVREGRRTRFIPLAEVDWFEADGNYIVVHAADQRYRTRGTITAIESGLDPRQFARIHRRMVVNMDRVREMSPLPGGDGLLLLGGGATLRLSRTYRARVR